MKRLLIVGAGGFGREMFAAAREALGYGEDFIVAGFLDDNLHALDGFSGYPQILGTLADYKFGADDVFITAVGSIPVRRKIVAQIEARGGVFATVVHRSAVIGPNVSIGVGSFIAPNVSLTADVSIGRHTCVFHNTSIGHDTIVGDFAHIYAQCSLGGSVRIASGTNVYPGAVVTPRRKIGEDAVVGALSAVFSDVPPRVTVLGNPAAPLR